MPTRPNTLFPKVLHAEIACYVRDLVMERYGIQPGWLATRKSSRIYEVAYLFRSNYRYPGSKKERCAIHIDVAITNHSLFIIANDHDGIMYQREQQLLRSTANGLLALASDMSFGARIYPMSLANPHVFDRLCEILDEMITSPDNKIKPHSRHEYVHDKIAMPSLLQFCCDLFTGISSIGTVDHWIEQYDAST